MIKNILIGIGGTGAKIVESALFLLAAGIGPDDAVHIGLIDQDNSNGNVQRTETLLNLICRIQDQLATGNNQLDWADENEDNRTSLLSIPLRKLFADKDESHWRPAPEKLTNLRDILQHDRMTPAQKDLFDLLFRPAGAADSEKEQDLILAEGYRGRAHVGSAALLSALHHDSPELLTTMKELMKNGSNTGGEVRIMLVGSLFGGTGAAGFPTIARSLHRMRSPGNEDRIKSDAVYIGGVLMLPYFGFRDPDDSGANVITTSQLLPQARVAVNYYDRLIEQEGVFDHLYISGWDEMITLNYHEPGRGEQRNPALLPELVAALGVVDFFTADKIEPRAQPMMAARRSAGAMGWADLPVSDGLRRTVFERLAQALRFAVVWRNMAEPGMDDRKSGLLSRTPEIRSSWIRKLTQGTDWQGATATLRDDLKLLTGELVKWAGNLRLFAPLRVELWNPEPLLARNDRSQPQNPIDLHVSRSETETNSDVTQIVLPADPKQLPVDSSRIFADLNEDSVHGKSRGLGRLIAAVHRAARPFRTEGQANGQ
jgi:hypothetical protein